MEAFAECSQEGRDDVLYYLLHVHPGRTLLFLNTISSVRRVAAMLKALDINAQVRPRIAHLPPCVPGHVVVQSACRRHRSCFSVPGTRLQTLDLLCMCVFCALLYHYSVRSTDPCVCCACA